MRDLIVALVPDAASAERARTELVRAGFATDRVDVASASDPGPAATMPTSNGQGRFQSYFGSLLKGCKSSSSDARQLADSVEQGAAAVVVHPRGSVEVGDADKILARHEAKIVCREIQESLAETPVVGEHAAGKR